MRQFLGRQFAPRQFVIRQFALRPSVGGVEARATSASGGASARARRRGEIAADGADEELALLAAILEAAEDVL